MVELFIMGFGKYMHQSPHNIGLEVFMTLHFSLGHLRDIVVNI